MRSYLLVFKNNIINALDYRLELVMSVFTAFLYFSGFSIFWSVAYKSSDLQEVGGFTLKQIIFYYLVLQIFADIIDSKFAFRLNAYIWNGTITNLIIKPVQLKKWLLFEDLGKLLPLLVVKIVVFGILYFVLWGPFDLELSNILLFLGFLPVSLVINFSIYFMIGSIAFWMTNAKSLIYAIRRIAFFLSGGYLPLMFFPDGLRKILDWMPFNYVFNVPINLLQNGSGLQEFTKYLVVAVVWLVFLWFSSNFLLKFAIKQNESVGI